MTIHDVNIHPNEDGVYFVEYTNEDNQRVTVQFDNELLATQFFNSLFYTPQSQ
jgi:hypothetical protein